MNESRTESTETQRIRDEVWAAVQGLNRAWTVERDADRLRAFFHPDMIAVTPTDRLRREGREACVAGWMGFVESCRITRWEEIDPKVEIFADGKAAVVTYYFDMTIVVGGQSVNLAGRDMFTLVREHGRWLAVADQFSPYPAA